MKINKALITLKNLKKNEYIIFLFHGVIEYNKYQVRNYTKNKSNKNHNSQWKARMFSNG